VNPVDPGAKPPVIRRMTMVLPRGAVIDTTAPARCNASDGELIAGGTAACPEESRVGTGRLVSDTGSEVGLPRFTVNRLTDFNAEDEVIALTESEEPPTRLVGRSQVSGRRIVTTFPSLPGGPPDFALAYKRLVIRTMRIDTDAGAYLRTPARCPRSGSWSTRFVFEYKDGVEQTEHVRSPCNPG
jgi:hypothetical protein